MSSELRNKAVIQGVLFDLDGVLVNSIPSHGRAWSWIMQTIGLEVDPFVAPLTEGLKSRRIARLIFEEAGFRPGLEMDDEQLDELIERKRNYYRSIVGEVTISDHVMETVKFIRSKVDGIALVTSSSRINLDHVVTPAQQEVFDVILWADSVTHSKPHPEPYLKAAESLGIAPKHCLVVENAPLGIRSARAAGMWCLGISSTMSPENLGEAHLVMSSVLELADEKGWAALLDAVSSQGEPGRLDPEEILVAPIPVRIQSH